MATPRGDLNPQALIIDVLRILRARENPDDPAVQDHLLEQDARAVLAAVEAARAEKRG